MTMDFAVPLITGLFLGGIITEVSWVLRLRQIQGQLDLSHSAELNKAATLTVAENRQAIASSSSLRALQHHLDVEAGTTPATESANVSELR